MLFDRDSVAIGSNNNRWAVVPLGRRGRVGQSDWAAIPTQLTSFSPSNLFIAHCCLMLFDRDSIEIASAKNRCMVVVVCAGSALREPVGQRSTMHPACFVVAPWLLMVLDRLCPLCSTVPVRRVLCVRCVLCVPLCVPLCAASGSSGPTFT